MRRVKDRGTPMDSEMLVSPGEIIARAAATVPDRAIPETDEDKARVWTPPPVRSETSMLPAPLLAGMAPNRRARRHPRHMLRHAWFYASRGAVAAVLLGVVVGLPVWLFSSGVIDDAGRQASETYASWRRDAHFAGATTLDRLIVEGRNRTALPALRAALQIKKGDSMFAADPWAIKKRLEALPWVRGATVERRFPGLVLVKLAERKPVARLRDGTRTLLVDESGTIVPVAAEKEHDNLVLLSGEGAPAAANALLALMATQPELAKRVVSATRHGNRRWDVAFEGGAMVQLPDGYERAAFAKLAEFERAHALLARGAVTYDMRLPDRLVIRSVRGPAPPDASDKPTPGKKNGRTG